MTKTAEVTVYSTPTCPYCKMAKEFLKHHQVEFTNINVADDEKQAEAMIHKSGQMGVPVIVVKKGKEEDVLVGFDKVKLAEVLGITA